MSVHVTDAGALPSPLPLIERGTPSDEPIVETASRRARNRRRVRVSVQRGTLALTVVAVLLGVYVTAQWQSKPRRASAAPEYRQEVANATTQRLEAEQADLKRRIADLRSQIALTQRTESGDETDLTHLKLGIEQQKMLAGTVAMRGPGLRIVLDDSSVKAIPAKEDPSMYIVHEYQLRDIVNLLWVAGAEAISINGERMVAPSSIYCVGSTILINDTRTSPPYEFLVIGDQAVLDQALADPSGLKALKSRIKLYGLQLNVQKGKDILVPAFAGSLNIPHVLPDASAGVRLTRRGSP